MFQVVNPQPDDDEMARIGAEMRRLLSPLPSGEHTDWAALLARLDQAVATAGADDPGPSDEPPQRAVTAAG